MLFIIYFLSLSLGFAPTLFAQEEIDKTLSPYFHIESNGSTESLPLKSTKAEVNIAGSIADVSIQQTYTNTGTDVIEAVYVFPASTRAAVYAMKMKIGNRTIDAEIREKEKARQEYAQAKAEGKRASLLEQSRPNVFQMNVANIMPGDIIEVTLQYTELLIPTEGVYEFVYPTVVGPRYSEQPEATASLDDQFIANPFTKSGKLSNSSFDIQVHLAAGVPLQNIGSSSHQVNIHYPSIKEADINLKASEMNRGNKDFILSYELSGNQIESGLMLYEGEEENFFTLMVQPPKQVTKKKIPSREYIFVVDVSGSMNGFPMDVSKNLLRNLIANLNPTDKFNIVLFAGSTYVMANESLEATQANLQKGLNVLQNQRGGGGTRLLQAMQTAMALPRCMEDLSRSLVLITDGYISVEREVFDLVQNNLNNTNVFTFGIGSSVNRYLLEGLAHVGMGEPIIVTNLIEAPVQAEKFRKFIQSPVLTQINVDFGGFEVYDVEPKTVPDVLAERPIIIHGKWKGKPKGVIKLKGFSGEGKYKKNFNVEEFTPDPKHRALTYLWARERIRLLDDYKVVDGDEAAKEEVTALGLKYSLMTQYTSFIAVDHEEVAAKGSHAKTVKQALPMPENVSDYAVGFDVELEGVVRKSTSTKIELNHSTVKIKSLASGLNIAKNIGLKLALEHELNRALECHKGGIAISENVEIEIELDSTGKIIGLNLTKGNLEESIFLCMAKKLQGIQLKGIQLSTALTLNIEAHFVL